MYYIFLMSTVIKKIENSGWGNSQKIENSGVGKIPENYFCMKLTHDTFFDFFPEIADFHPKIIFLAKNNDFRKINEKWIVLFLKHLKHNFCVYR